MNERELRIGNFIRYEGKGTFSVRMVSYNDIEGVWSDDGAVSSENDVPEKFAGIPIDEAWLKRLGFVDGKIHRFQFDMRVQPFRTETQGVFPGEWEVTLLDSIPHSLHKRIHFIHQLQNLFFALTGEELTIK